MKMCISTDEVLFTGATSAVIDGPTLDATLLRECSREFERSCPAFVAGIAPKKHDEWGLGLNKSNNQWRAKQQKRADRKSE